jgi:hypothetical protein
MKYLKQFYNWFVLLFNPTTRKRLKSIARLGKRKRELNDQLMTKDGRKVTREMLEVTKWKRQGRSDRAMINIIRSRRIKFAKDHRMSKPTAGSLQVKSTGTNVIRRKKSVNQKGQ